MHTVSMPNVLIRDLPPEVHATLQRRAKAAGQSLQQYLARELTRMAKRLTNEELFARIEMRGNLIELTDDEIVTAIHADRPYT